MANLFIKLTKIKEEDEKYVSEEILIRISDIRDVVKIQIEDTYLSKISFYDDDFIYVEEDIDYIQSKL